MYSSAEPFWVRLPPFAVINKFPLQTFVSLFRTGVLGQLWDTLGHGACLHCSSLEGYVCAHERRASSEVVVAYVYNLATLLSQLLRPYRILLSSQLDFDIPWLFLFVSPAGKISHSQANIRQEHTKRSCTAHRTLFFSFKSRKQETRWKSVFSFFSSRLLYMIYTIHNNFPYTRNKRKQKEKINHPAALPPCVHSL